MLLICDGRLAQTGQSGFAKTGVAMAWRDVRAAANTAGFSTEIIKRDTAIMLAGGMGILILLVLLGVLIRNRKQMRQAKAEAENFNQLRQAFINADESLVYLKDENLKYVFVNNAVERFYQMKAEAVVGHDDFSLKDDDFSRKRRETDLAVLERKSLIVGEEEWGGRVYKTTKFPVRMLNGKYGVGAYKTDITEEREKARKLQRMMYRHKILVDVLTMSFQSRQEQLDYVLHQSLLLTESQYGYIYLYDEEDREFTLNSWTNGVMHDCAVTEQQTKYQLDKTGIWGEVVRQRKPIIVNDFAQANPLKRGYPEGHVKLARYMSIPVLVDGKIVAVVGLANNASGYDDNDVTEMTLLMGGVWNALKRKEMQVNLSIERNKYLQTLISIGDGVLVVNKDGIVEMLNTVARNLTGWTQEAAFGRHYKDVFVLSSEIRGHTINDPIADVLATNRKQELDNHALLTASDGRVYCLEDSAAPIMDNTGKTIGVVLVFRDVTEKKEQKREIEYLSCHDTLTGLHNRRCFDSNRVRIDNPGNLPLSVVFADINGLKLTNDIFGHSAGDELIIKAAEILQQACRQDDVIARVGGDEFIMLLPNTTKDNAEKILARIRAGFMNARVKAIQCSISLGLDTKVSPDQVLDEIIANAENGMYKDKSMNRQAVDNGIIDTIIGTLHARSPVEKRHSINVSHLCVEIGNALDLSETDIEKAGRAGYLHDIGKIVLEEGLLSEGSIHEDTLKAVRQHAVVGYRILNLFDDTLDLAECVYNHHEKWDGTGYPRGLKGAQIPLVSRIISVAEAYDRMMNSRDVPMDDKKANAIGIIKEAAGTQFDPLVAQTLIRIVTE